MAVYETCCRAMELQLPKQLGFLEENLVGIDDKIVRVCMCWKQQGNKEAPEDKLHQKHPPQGHPIGYITALCQLATSAAE